MATNASAAATRSALESELRHTVPHLSTSDTQNLAEILRRLITAYRPEQVYLFGSKARGDDGPDSDFDILLVVSDTSLPERKRSALGYAALRGTGIASDVLVWPKSAFERRRHLKASFPATVIREGHLVYAA